MLGKRKCVGPFVRQNTVARWIWEGQCVGGGGGGGLSYWWW